MYGTNKLLKLAHKLKKTYKDVVLDSEYKTALFRSHLRGATYHLEKAGELLGHCPVDDDSDNGDGDKVFLFSLILIALLAILVYFM